MPREPLDAHAAGRRGAYERLLVLLAGDMVAAPGCLSEIAWASAVEASRLAVAAARGREPVSLAGAA